MMCKILDKNGNIVSRSRNLRGIREYVGKHCVTCIDIDELVGTQSGEGRLSIVFDNGNTFTTDFADFTILCYFVRQWRNVKGSPLRTVDRQGKVTMSKAGY